MALQSRGFSLPSSFQSIATERNSQLGSKASPSSLQTIATERYLHLGHPLGLPQCFPICHLQPSSAVSRESTRNVQLRSPRKVSHHKLRASQNSCETGTDCKISEDNCSSSSVCLLEEDRRREGIAQRSSVALSFTKESLNRRSILVGIAAFSCLSFKIGNALAVKQVQLAGRIPGLSPPDDNGLRTYRRPDAKSGGHGVGWSPMIPYSFKVPEEWEEVPVSIADLGGTEIDLRFSNKQEGNISVVVAPVLRFASDLGDDAKIENVGPPEKVIDAFGPELVGQNVEGQVKDMEVTEHDGRKYYLYELEVPHVLITATAAGNRLYLMTISANGRQWKKYGEELKQIAGSFRVG